MRMETKKCTKCGKVKSLTMFTIRRDTKIGVRSHCKKCLTVYTKEYYAKNKDHQAVISKKYRNQNKKKISDRGKKYYSNNKEHILKRMKEFRLNNKEKMSEQYLKYYEKHKEAILKRSAEYRKRNPLKWSKFSMQWAKDNLEKTKIHQKRYYTNNRQTCISKGRKEREEMRKAYVALTLGLHVSDCSNELIELKRSQLKLYRATKQ